MSDNSSFREVVLIDGTIAIVSHEDYDLVITHRWRSNNKGYVVKSSGFPRTSLHRLILDAPKGTQVDHINRNKLDNRRSNLRLCNQNQNEANKPSRRGSRSSYKGVHWHIVSKRWVAKIRKNSQSIHLGCFLEENDAALAYNKAAKEIHGEFAYLNEIN